MSKFSRSGDGIRRLAEPVARVVTAAVMVLAVSACGRGATTDAKAKALPGIKEFGLTEEQFAEHIEKSQALIAACMTEAGFQYIPVDVRTVEAAQERVREDPELTHTEYKQKYGYGVTTRFDSPVRDTGLGPNLQIWQGLPEPDKAAYSHTLWGDDPRADFVFAMDEEDFSRTGGCTRKAVAQVFTAEQLTGAYVNPKDELVDSDPRIIKALKAWSKCMHEKGFEYEEDQDEIISEYQDRLDKLLDGDDPATLTGPVAEALRNLQEQEIAVSLADYECEIKHTDDVYKKVEIEVFGQPVSHPPPRP